MRIENTAQLAEYRARLEPGRDSQRPCVNICGGTGCHAYGAQDVIAAAKQLFNGEARATVRVTGCPGFCEQGPIVVVQPDGILYVHVRPEDIPLIVEETVLHHHVIKRLLYTDPATKAPIEREQDVPFYAKQKRLLLNQNGVLDPTSIDEYIVLGGYGSLVKALASTPGQVVDDILHA
jgi:(2Fe-2S) ferredoxin